MKDHEGLGGNDEGIYYSAPRHANPHCNVTGHFKIALRSSPHLLVRSRLSLLLVVPGNFSWQNPGKANHMYEYVEREEKL